MVWKAWESVKQEMWMTSEYRGNKSMTFVSMCSESPGVNRVNLASGFPFPVSLCLLGMFVSSTEPTLCMNTVLFFECTH